MNLKEKESVYTSSRDGNLQYLKVSTKKIYLKVIKKNVVNIKWEKSNTSKI